MLSLYVITYKIQNLFRLGLLDLILVRRNIRHVIRTVEMDQIPSHVTLSEITKIEAEIEIQLFTTDSDPSRPSCLLLYLTEPDQTRTMTQLRKY